MILTGKPKAFLSGFGEGFLGGVAGGGGIVGRFISHGVIGGAFNEIRGGKFGGGFLAAGFSAALGPLGPQGTWSGAAFGAAIGGVASVLGGGKFADGAVTGAFAYLATRAALSGKFSYADGDADIADEIPEDERLERIDRAIEKYRAQSGKRRDVILNRGDVYAVGDVTDISGTLHFYDSLAAAQKGMGLISKRGVTLPRDISQPLLESGG